MSNHTDVYHCPHCQGRTKHVESEPPPVVCVHCGKNLLLTMEDFDFEGLPKRPAMLTPLPGDYVSADDLHMAAQHLATSEKGRDALDAISCWLDKSGVSLDRVNQEAVLTLLQGVWGKFPGTARDEMREALERTKPR